MLDFKHHLRHHARPSRRPPSELYCLLAHAVRPELAVVRAAIPSSRPTIIGRPDFYIRYGEKEREAVASFDFLDELSTTSSSISDSPENCPSTVGLKITEV